MKTERNKTENAAPDRGILRSAQDDRGPAGAAPDRGILRSARDDGRTPRRMWTLRQDLQRNGVLQLYIYGDVEGDGWDWWTGEKIESETSAEHFRKELGKYPNVSEIEIFINSFGGEVFEGTAIYNQLRRHPAHKSVHIDGFACSIASVIAMAGDEVVMPRNTLMMVHNMWMGVVGNAAQLRKAADDLDTINAAGRQAYLQKAGEKLSEERLAEMMDAETWLTAEECIELGLADRFDDEDADMSAAAGILQKANDSLEQQLRRSRALAACARTLLTPEEPAAPQAAEEPGEPAASAGDEEGPGLMAFLAGVRI